MTTSESFVSVTRSTLENSNGIAIDIGGSAVKIAYRHKDDWKELQQQAKDNSTAKVRLRVFAKEDLEEAFKFVSENCHITRDCDEPPLISITGMGGHQLSQLINQKLNVTTQVLSELDCFVNGFAELSRTVPQEEFEHMRTAERKKELQAIMARWKQLCSIMFGERGDGGERSMMRPMKMVKSLDLTLGMGDTNSDLPIAQAIPNLYPFLLYFVCSASTFLTVHSEKDYELFGQSTNGGGVFLGLGNIICRAKKSYDELIDLAEKGNSATVDETMVAFKPESGQSQENVYAQMLQSMGFTDETVYPFRHVITGSPDSLKTEDLVLSLLKTTIRYHTDMLFNTSIRKEIPHVFLVGSFFNRQLVRTIFEDESARHKIYTASANGGKGMDTEIHFVKAGGYLGCIGAFLENPASTKPAPSQT